METDLDKVPNQPVGRVWERGRQRSQSELLLTRPDDPGDAASAAVNFRLYGNLCCSVYTHTITLLPTSITLLLRCVFKCPQLSHCALFHCDVTDVASSWFNLDRFPPVLKLIFFSSMFVTTESIPGRSPHGVRLSVRDGPVYSSVAFLLIFYSLISAPTHFICHRGAAAAARKDGWMDG